MRFKWAIRRIFIILLTSFLIYSTFLAIYGGTDDEEPDYPYNFDPAKDEIFVKNYLKLLQMGRASARPVIEKEAKVHENYWCFLKFPKITRKSGNWLTMAGVEVFSAYFDDRENSLYTQNSAVQILVMSNHSIEKANVLIFCNIFSTSTREYAAVKGYIREIWQTGWDPRNSFQVPSLITCPIPTRMPKSSQNLVVSLTRRRCHNVPEAMQVLGKPEQGKGAKKDVAVCLKGLDYQEDISGRLLEWIEMQFLFGADSISIYYFFLTNQTRKMLDYYEKSSRVKLVSIFLYYS
uniref:Glycosyltransferase family 92 protein n=1 Tax=Caenorhabditis japonica TaxID=281687 RepID=A0A8R1IC63_CAEJA